MDRGNKNYKTWFSGASFRLQLAAAFVIGILLLALIAPTVTAVRSSDAVRQTLVKNGARLTETFADQSRLALLYRSPENGQQAAEATLNYPDVESVSILTPEGKVLLNLGASGAPGGASEMPVTGPEMLTETERYWVFGAPVYSTDEQEDLSPFDIRTPERELLGYVYVRVGKGTLDALGSQILTTNFTITLAAAGILLLVLLAITERVTKPVRALSGIMGRAADGEKNLRAVPVGPEDIRLMEESFNHMMGELESREKELEQARDTALQSARLKGEFAANVTHELRTPLSSMLGLMELVASDQGLNPRLREYIDVARNSGNTLMSLINEVLDFSKIDAGRLKARPVEFQPETMLDELIGIFGAQANRKGLELGYVVDPGVPTIVNGEEARLRQVLVNLVGNAIKFTDEGGVKIHVSIRAKDGEGVLLLFEVEDTGIGIEREALDRIFEAFAQADGSLNRSYGGTGLGLAISRQLVHFMGGDINVRSRPGHGSCFGFTALFAESHAAHEETNRGYERLAGLRALVVDTSKMNRDFVATFFRKWGVYHKSCKEPEAALDMLRAAARNNRPFDIVLADYMLPRISGIGLAAEIAEDSYLHRTRTILMTAARVSAESDRYDPSVAAAIEKPIREERLFEVIDRVLTAESIAEASDEVPAALPSPMQPLRNIPAGTKVLVVEDHVGNQLVAQGMLENLGCEAQIVASGEEAIEAVSFETYDVILMDCQMPGLDGYETTRRIRAEQHVHIPIVAMTAHSKDQVWNNCVDAGMDGFIRKPISLSNLRGVIGEWVGKKKHGEPLAKDRYQVTESAAPVYAMRRSDSAIDDKIIGALCRELGESSCQSVIESFVAEMPIYTRAMRQALDLGDFGTLREQAHKIKGAAGNFGAFRLDDICNQIEVLADPESVEELKLQFERLEEEGRRVVRALKQYLTGAEEAPAAVRQGAGQMALVADDDKPTRLAIAALLRSEGYAVTEASNGQAALDVCEREMPDIVILDAVMPKVNGFDVCSQIRQKSAGMDVPILIATALDDSVAIRQAFEAGASDYLAKPIDFAAMRGRVARLLEARTARQKAEELAFHDSLTDLPNRTHLTERLTQLVNTAKEAGYGIAVLFLDLDRFKHINEKVGHDVGDLLLRAVGSRLKNLVRQGDLVARFGGDEYAIVLNRITDAGVVEAVTQKIMQAMATPFSLHNREYSIGASIGVALYPEHGDNVADLVAHAETAMYCAKERSKRSGALDAQSQYCLFEPGLELQASQEMQRQEELRRAIRQGEIVVYYQPKLSLKSNRITGMEALCRWNHPERGIVPPNEFIPLAEKTGLIHELGNSVLRNACSQLREWNRKGYPQLQVSVNLSGIEFEREDLIERIATVLNETALPAGQLALEITESVLVDNTDTVPRVVEQIRAMGISISIDDFGTGYSSLLHLKRLPYDTLKIDREFVKDVTVNAHDASMVRAIIAMAASLDLAVVAEGVETEEQREFLNELGCDEIQGYLVSRPLSAAVFETTILRQSKILERSRDQVVTKFRQPGQEG
jgi:diguanylate cyclase (GGDEF)-like protein